MDKIIPLVVSCIRESSFGSKNISIDKCKNLISTIKLDNLKYFSNYLCYNGELIDLCVKHLEPFFINEKHLDSDLLLFLSTVHLMFKEIKTIQFPNDTILVEDILDITKLICKLVFSITDYGEMEKIHSMFDIIIEFLKLDFSKSVIDVKLNHKLLKCFC